MGTLYRANTELEDLVGIFNDFTINYNESNAAYMKH